MTTAVARRRGTTADNNRFTGIEGEITVDLGSGELRVHTGDGKVGGYGTARKDLTNVTQDSLANKGIAKNDLSNVDDDKIFQKASNFASSQSGAGIAYKNLSNVQLTNLGEFLGDDDTPTQAGGLAYKDLSNVTGTAFFNNLGIARRDMSNVTDEVVLNKAVARATVLKGEGLAYKNLNNTKLSNYGTFLGTDDSGTAAGGLAYKDMSNVTNINKLADLGLARKDLTNVTDSSILSKASSAAVTAGGAGLAYINLSNTLLDSYGDFMGTDNTPSKAGGLAYKNLSNTKLSDYDTFIGTDDSPSSAAGLAYKDLSNVTGTAFFDNLGIAKSNLSNVNNSIVLNKVNEEIQSNSGEGVAYKNLSNLKLSSFDGFTGTDDSATKAGGLAYKDLSNTKLSDYSNFVGEDDVNKTGLAYRDLSNTTINNYLNDYALKSGSDINIDNLADRGLAKSDMSNIDQDLLHKQHLNLLLNNSGAANFNGYVDGTNLSSNDIMAYDLWYTIDEGNTSITNYNMSRNKTDQSIIISGSFVQELRGIKSLLKGKRLYVWCSSLSSETGLSVNFLDGKNYNNKYFTNNKPFTQTTINGKSVYAAEFDFSESTADALLSSSINDVTFFISSTSSHTIQHLQIELNDMTTYENKREEQEASEVLSLSSKMNQIFPIIAMSATAPEEHSLGDSYYNTTDKKIYTYELLIGSDAWVNKGAPVEAVLYFLKSMNTAYFWNGTDLVASEGAVNWGSVVGTITNQTDLINYIADIDATAVHKTGTETVAGAKTFSDIATFSNSIIGVKAVASNSKSSTTVPTIGWVNDPTTATNVVHRDGNETITGNKTLSGNLNSSGTNTWSGANTFSGSSVFTVKPTSVKNAATSSTTSTELATVGWANDPVTATNIVHRSGNETISGTKTFNNQLVSKYTSAGDPIRIYMKDTVRGTVPASNQFSHIRFDDKNGNWLGYLGYNYYPDGQSLIEIACRSQSTDSANSIRLKCSPSGVITTSCPTPPNNSNSSEIATTAWVNTRITARLPKITYW